MTDGEPRNLGTKPSLRLPSAHPQNASTFFLPSLLASCRSLFSLTFSASVFTFPSGFTSILFPAPPRPYTNTFPSPPVPPVPPDPPLDTECVWLLVSEWVERACEFRFGVRAEKNELAVGDLPPWEEWEREGAVVPVLIDEGERDGTVDAFRGCCLIGTEVDREEDATRRVSDPEVDDVFIEDDPAVLGCKEVVSPGEEAGRESGDEVRMLYCGGAGLTSSQGVIESTVGCGKNAGVVGELPRRRSSADKIAGASKWEAELSSAACEKGTTGAGSARPTWKGVGLGGGGPVGKGGGAARPAAAAAIFLSFAFFSASSAAAFHPNARAIGSEESFLFGGDRPEVDPTDFLLLSDMNDGARLSAGLGRGGVGGGGGAPSIPAAASGRSSIDGLVFLWNTLDTNEPLRAALALMFARFGGGSRVDVDEAATLLPLSLDGLSTASGL